MAQDPLELPDGADQQVLPARHEPHGAPEPFRELTPDEARRFMERAFANLTERRRNAEILLAAKAKGAVRHRG